MTMSDQSERFFRSEKARVLFLLTDMVIWADESDEVKGIFLCVLACRRLFDLLVFRFCILIQHSC